MSVESLEVRKPSLISADPKVRFGAPTVKGTGISVEVILDRLAGGDKPTELDEDYNFKPGTVSRLLGQLSKLVNDLWRTP